MDGLNPLASEHLPYFITAPGETDRMMVFCLVLILVGIMTVGVLYLRLHALPERMAHGGNARQFEIVAILALLALVTHNGLFWVAALILALVRMPDFLTPLRSIARSQSRRAGLADRPGPAVAATEPGMRDTHGGGAGA